MRIQQAQSRKHYYFFEGQSCFPQPHEAQFPLQLPLPQLQLPLPRMLLRSAKNTITASTASRIQSMAFIPLPLSAQPKRHADHPQQQRRKPGHAALPKHDAH